MAKKAPLPIPPDITARLSDPDYKVRAAAVRELGETRNPAAIDHLLPMLADKTITVRAKVGQQLKKFVGKDPRVLPTLVELCADVHGVHKWLFNFLTALGPKLTPTLLQTIDHPDRSVRQNVLLLFFYADEPGLLKVLPRLIAQAQNYPTTLLESFLKAYERKAKTPDALDEIHKMQADLVREKP